MEKVDMGMWLFCGERKAKHETSRNTMTTVVQKKELERTEDQSDGGLPTLRFWRPMQKRSGVNRSRKKL